MPYYLAIQKKNGWYLNSRIHFRESTRIIDPAIGLMRDIVGYYGPDGRYCIETVQTLPAPDWALCSPVRAPHIAESYSLPPEDSVALCERLFEVRLDWTVPSEPVRWHYSGTAGVISAVWIATTNWFYFYEVSASLPVWAPTVAEVLSFGAMLEE